MVLNIYYKVGRKPDYLYEPSVLGLSGLKLKFRVKILRIMQENSVRLVC